MPFNNGWFVSSVSRFCTLTTLCLAAHSVLAIYGSTPPQVTIACRPSSIIARFKNTEFLMSDN